MVQVSAIAGTAGGYKTDKLVFKQSKRRAGTRMY